MEYCEYLRMCSLVFSLLQCFATSCEVHLSSMGLSVPQKWMVPISSTVMVISSDMCWRLGPWRLGLDGSTSRNTKLDWTSKRLRHQHVFKWNYTKNVLRRMSNRFWDLFRDGLWIVVLLLTCRLQKRFWPSFWCNMWQLHLTTFTLHLKYFESDNISRCLLQSCSFYLHQKTQGSSMLRTFAA